MKKGVILFIVFWILLWIAAVSAAYYVWSEISAPSFETGIEKSITVPQGYTATQVAVLLKQENILSDPLFFQILCRLQEKNSCIKAGTYVLSPTMSPLEIYDILSSGREQLFPITIPEGLTRLETAVHIEAKGFGRAEKYLAHSENGNFGLPAELTGGSLEGFLFPETYLLNDQADEEKLIEVQTKRFMEIYDELWRNKPADYPLTAREWVIMASLIEEEAKLDEERSLISAVFHNRLKNNMKLQCDPTVIYSLPQFDGNLRKRDLAFDSPYNTYVYRGLPPGPITNPGKASLYAALYPDNVSYLYFVAKNDGSHHFSTTLREHQKAVNKHQR